MYEHRSMLAALLAVLVIAAACSADSTNFEVAVADAPADNPADQPDPTVTPEPRPTEDPEPEVTDEPDLEPEPAEEPAQEPAADDAASSFASSMTDSAGLDQLTETDALCVGLGLVERLGAATVLAMSADDYVPQGDQVAQMVDALYECVPAETIGQAFSAGLAADIGNDVPAESLACIGEQYSDRANIESVLGIFADFPDADFDDLPPETKLEVLDPVFSCVGFGTMIAGVSAEDGLVLSDTSIACLDDSGDELLRAILLFDDFNTAPDDVQADMIDLFFSCLSAEELAAIAG